MPIYDYICSGCGHAFEQIEGVVMESEKVKCPQCSSIKVEKTFSTFNVGSTYKCRSDYSSCGTCPGGGCEIK